MNCNIKNTLLKFSLKYDDNNTNKIASTTSTEKEDLTVSIIEKIMSEGSHKSLINKIAAVTSTNNKGEVAELKSYLKL